MSHTFTGKKNIYHYNSDLSGEIAIVVSLKDIHKFNIKDLDDKEAEVMIDGEDFLSFMEEIIRDMKISKLEQASLDELIG